MAAIVAAAKDMKAKAAFCILCWPYFNKFSYTIDIFVFLFVPLRAFLHTLFHCNGVFVDFIVVAIEVGNGRYRMFVVLAKTTVQCFFFSF